MQDAGYRTPPREPIYMFGGVKANGIKGFHALDPDTGDPLWSTPIADHTNKVTMAIGSGRVVAVAGEGKVYCVACDGGRALWSAEVPRMEGGNARPPLITIQGGRVLVFLQWMLNCFTLDGEKLWEREMGVSAIGTERSIVEFHDPF